jgi:hypothetical protein
MCLLSSKAGGSTIQDVTDSKSNYILQGKTIPIQAY